MSLVTFLIIFIIVFIAMVPISMIVEALRPAASAPERLSWSEDIPIQYTDIDGLKIRYIKTGQGPTLVLLHTLRTQLDIFQKMIPELSKTFTVYAFDYPGHGWSDIPEADYDLEYFVDAVTKVLDKLDVTDATIAGVSIGGSIPLVMAARKNPRIKKVVSINPYDYPGKGPARGNLLANFFMSITFIPILGSTFMRFRIRLVEKIIFEGGVYDSESLPATFLEECFVVGERPGQLQGFMNLIRNSNSFMKGHDIYKDIVVPVLIIYGDQDWARQDEKERTISEVPGAIAEHLDNAGHFLSLEYPSILIEKIKAFSKD